MIRSFSIIALFAILFSCPVLALDKAEPVLKDAKQRTAKVRPGFRLDIEGGPSFLKTEPADPEVDLQRTGYHIGVYMGNVFNCLHSSLGVAADFRRHSYTDPSLFDYSSGTYGATVSLNTIYVGPQYTFLFSPYTTVAFIGDLSIGYTKIIDLYNKKSYDSNAFGCKCSVGVGFALGGNNYVTIKLTAFNCKYKVYTDKRDGSSLNLSLGFTIGQ